MVAVWLTGALSSFIISKNKTGDIEYFGIANYGLFFQMDIVAYLTNILCLIYMLTGILIKNHWKPDILGENHKVWRM